MGRVGVAEVGSLRESLDQEEVVLWRDRGSAGFQARERVCAPLTARRSRMVGSFSAMQGSNGDGGRRSGESLDEAVKP